MSVVATHQTSEEKLLVVGRDRQLELGQFFTPDFVADFLAGLFVSRWQHWNVLDAGAGQGALSAALVRQLCNLETKPQSISITVCEIDTCLIETLRQTLTDCEQECERVGIRFSATIHNVDFVEFATPLVRSDLFASHRTEFNAAIVNPPYRKIKSDSTTRLLLRSAGIETGNLYTGFISLITKLLVDQGELVAITPRSFCNGPYFKPFRTDFLEAMSLRRLHLFESRSAAFRSDEVLQENLVFQAVKSLVKSKHVAISSSSGFSGGVVSERVVSYQDVVAPADAEKFIHLTEDETQVGARALMSGLESSLAELGLTVSTGRVVDFRAKDFLRPQPGIDTVPLIYPCHFNGGFVHWPKEPSRKPNAIVSNEQTRELLLPGGIYVLVKRFTSKEERRRVVACICDCTRLEASLVGFENHLNYFHVDGRGLTMTLAKGLAAFLNSSVVDIYFRQFNGHTQVNATDLRSLNYPTKAELEKLGRRISTPLLPQTELDALVEEELF